jgi:hypothetical protein
VKEIVMRRLALALAALAVTAPLSARDRGVPLADPAGKAVDCISLTRIRASHVRSDQVIDFEVAGGRLYRNTLPNSCPQLGFEERFGYAVSIGQLCSTDIIHVLSNNGMRGASCGLGQFQPITLVKAK